MTRMMNPTSRVKIQELYITLYIFVHVFVLCFLVSVAVWQALTKFWEELVHWKGHGDYVGPMLAAVAALTGWLLLLRRWTTRIGYSELCESYDGHLLSYCVANIKINIKDWGILIWDQRIGRGYADWRYVAKCWRAWKTRYLLLLALAEALPLIPASIVLAEMPLLIVDLSVHAVASSLLPYLAGVLDTWRDDGNPSPIYFWITIYHRYIARNV